MKNVTTPTNEGNATYIEGLLRQMGFDKIRRKNGGRPGYIACCRFHEERNPSFSISDTGMWMCWTCGVRGNLKQLIEKLGNGVLDWRDALRMTGAQLRRISEPARIKKMANLPDDFSEYSIPGEVPAVIAKRLEWDTIRKFHLGFCTKYPNKDRCIVPIFYKGKCVGYHGRALRADVLPKYYNAEFDIKDYVFNYDGCVAGRELIILEGAFNCMSMVEKGFTNTVATFGTQFLGPQLEKIAQLRPTSVTICFDRDSSKIKNGKDFGRSGQKATLKLGAMLDEMFRVEVMVLPFDKDPNDLPKDLLVECHKRRIPYSKIAGGK